MSDFLHTEDTILYAACFDANGGVFEPFMTADTTIITDALNHASLIDGIRLAKAQRLIYQHMDMADLEKKLQESQANKYRMVVTDGVFSMDGDIAPLSAICDLAERYDALVLVDDSHATGFMGKTGRGTIEHCGVMNRVDLVTTTFGKALGGAMGGCVSGKKEMIEYLRQKSRPYLFSNSLSPVVTATTCAVLELLSQTTELRDQLENNTAYFREKMTAHGFDIRPGVHPIVPIMLYQEKLAHTMADEMLKQGIYVIGFSYAGLFADRRKELERLAVDTAEKLASINHYIESMGNDSKMTYQIVVKELPRVLVYSKRTIAASYDEFFTLMPEIGESIARTNPDMKCATDPAYCFNRYHDGEYKERDIDIEVCEAVTGYGNGKLPEGIEFKTIERVPEAACVLHKGPYSRLPEAYAAVFKWIEDNDCVPSDFPRESYIDGIWNKESDEDWLTELQVPILRGERD